MPVKARDGTKARPHFSVVVLAFGFLILYNILSWPPAVNLIDRFRLSNLKLGDLRLDLAVPAVIIVAVLWGWLVFTKDHA
jgi:hypothetical protein